MSEFRVFRNEPPHAVDPWPEAPPWRRFRGEPAERKLADAEEAGATFRVGPRLETWVDTTEEGRQKLALVAALRGMTVADLAAEQKAAAARPDREGEQIVALVNAAIHLRRPLLVTGKPGTGKSSLARAIAYELGLGELLVWPINSRSTLADGLYRYDAIARLQAVSEAKGPAPGGGVDTGGKAPPVAPLGIGAYIRLGPLGTALLPARRPRVLLIDEIDKSDVDLPNDLLNVFEEGQYEIPELVRYAKQTGEASVKVRAADGAGEDAEVPIVDGKVRCREFPIVVLTSNGEREFPPAFKRRCVRVTMPDPSDAKLAEIIASQFGKDAEVRKQVFERALPLVKAFLERRRGGDVATDQLLNALQLAMGGANTDPEGPLVKAIFDPLSGR